MRVHTVLFIADARDTIDEAHVVGRALAALTDALRRQRPDASGKDGLGRGTYDTRAAATGSAAVVVKGTGAPAPPPPPPPPPPPTVLARVRVCVRAGHRAPT